MLYLQCVSYFPTKLEPAESCSAAIDPSKLLAKGVMDSCDKKEPAHVEEERC